MWSLLFYFEHNHVSNNVMVVLMAAAYNGAQSHDPDISPREILTVARVPGLVCSYVSSLTIGQEQGQDPN